MANSCATEILVDYSAKSAAVHNGWPSFDARSHKHHANELVLLFIPKRSLFEYDLGQN